MYPNKRQFKSSSSLAQKSAKTAEKICSTCNVSKSKTSYSKAQWKGNKAGRRCIDCIETEKGNLPCKSCQKYFSDKYYTEKGMRQLKKELGRSDLVCHYCMMQENYECSMCHNDVKGYSFPSGESLHSENRRCMKCLRNNRLYCSLCEKNVKMYDFDQEEVDKEDQDRQCSKCKFLYCDVCGDTRPRAEFQSEEILKRSIMDTEMCEYSLMLELEENEDMYERRICNACQNSPFCWTCEKNYSPAQFEKKGDCFSSLCTMCLMYKQMRQRQRERDDLIFGVKQMKMPTFQIPGTKLVWSLDSHNENERSPSFSFGKLDLLRLLQTKTYELIFFYTTCSDDTDSYSFKQYRLSRATKGSITFKFDSVLKAVLSVDKSVRVGLSKYHYEDIEMNIYKDSYSDDVKSHQNDDRIILSLTDLNSLEEDEQREMHAIGGDIQLISKRQAVRYMPETESRDALDYTYHIRKKYAKSIEFQSNEEAEKLLQIYTEGERIMWLENHFDVPEKITKIIHTYLSEKPPPVFFFEENDILLSIEWENSQGAPSLSGCFVARPVEKNEPILEDIGDCIVERFIFDVEQTFANYRENCGYYPFDLFKTWVLEHPAIRNVKKIGASIIEIITSLKQIDCLMRDVIFEIVELGAVATKQCYLNLLSSRDESENRKQLLICFICSGYFPLEYNDRKMLDVLAEDKAFSDEYYSTLDRIADLFQDKIQGGYQINFKKISANQMQKCKKNLPQLKAGTTHDKDGPFAQYLRERSQLE